MSKRDNRYYAVITGDVVRSGRLSRDAFRDVQAVLKQGGDELRTRFGLPFPADTFRGDGWQLLVPDPEKALRVGLYFRAYLRSRAPSSSVDTRLAIGIGTIDVHPDDAIRVSEGRGEAYRVSGSLLDEKLPIRMRVGIGPGGHVPHSMRFDVSHRDTLGGWREVRSINTILSLLDFVVTGWTRAQARAVCGALLGWTQKRIAEEWSEDSITQQAVAQHLDRAGWGGVSEAIEYYEHIMTKWPPR